MRLAATSLRSVITAARTTRRVRGTARLRSRQERYQRHPELIGHMLHVR